MPVPQSVSCGTQPLGGCLQRFGCTPGKKSGERCEALRFAGFLCLWRNMQLQPDIARTLLTSFVTPPVCSDATIQGHFESPVDCR
eukprot:1833125-Rhodomonas_salina.3